SEPNGLDVEPFFRCVGSLESRRQTPGGRISMSARYRRRRWSLLPAIGGFALLLAAAPAHARVLDVTKRHVGFAHFTTIQRAVNAARPGDWIIIDRGVYPEAVKITKRNLHLRGLDRNRVIVDGRHRKNVNGIEVLKASRVWIEN